MLDVWVDGSTHPPMIAYVTSEGKRYVSHVQLSQVSRYTRRSVVKRKTGTISSAYIPILEALAIRRALSGMRHEDLRVHSDSRSILNVLNGAKVNEHWRSLIEQIKAQCDGRHVEFEYVTGQENRADKLFAIFDPSHPKVRHSIMPSDAHYDRNEMIRLDTVKAGGGH